MNNKHKPHNESSKSDFCIDELALRVTGKSMHNEVFEHTGAPSESSHARMRHRITASRGEVAFALRVALDSFIPFQANRQSEYDKGMVCRHGASSDLYKINSAIIH